MDAHAQGAIILALRPGGIPLVLCVSEVRHGGVSAVEPRLIACAVREPAVRPTNREVENEVKC